MSIARHHAEWLSLVPVSGPFLSLPVLMEAFNAGLEPHDPDQSRMLRQEYGSWQESFEKRRADPAPHQHWIKFVLTKTLELDDRVLAEGQAIPQTLQVEVPEHHELLRPNIVLIDPNTQKPRLLVQTYPRSQGLTSYVVNSRWKASPDTRMTELLHATGVRLGLVTNGEHWMLVDAPKGETTGYASWYASLWLEEPITLRAFRSLLSASRFFNVPDDQTLEALLTKSASNQQEVTDQLGYQVRRAVEVLIHSLDRADQDFGRELLAGVPEEVLYESALTVMMRLVFLFCAEERELIPSKPFPVYEQNYSVSTISKQLRDLADQHGEELLERRYDAWPRLLAAFRAVYGGLQHDDVHIPAYGGSLFNPDRFPFLEGRKLGTSWRDAEANPLPVNNRTVLHLLEALQLLQIKVPGGGPAEARRLSFRALDIEQIGHVYEGLLDHTAKRATEPFLGLAGTRDKEPELPLAELEKLLAKGEADLVKFLKEETGKSESALKKSLKAELDPQDASRFRTACQSDDALWKRVQPFAGLVRLDNFSYPVVIPKGSVFVTAGTDRRSSGTHYTPRELTEPIVKYTLEPLVYVGPAEGKAKDEWKLKSAKELLDLKICDMACGSGAFLVQAARYMAERLLEAWDQLERQAQPGRQQDFFHASGQNNSAAVRITPYGDPSKGGLFEQVVPLDPAERKTYAMRIIAQRCLYGVDKNPLASEMAKLSLWLLTLAKDKPFEFLDHSIRCGDSLVGLNDLEQLRHYRLKPNADDAMLFKGPLDEAVNEAINLRLKLEDMPANTVEDVERQETLLKKSNEKIARLRCAADLLVAAEFWGENAKDKLERVRHAAVKSEQYVERGPTEEFEKVAAKERRGQTMFHWPMEFPEVIIQRGGFDAFVGNPPFMGGPKLTGEFGHAFRDFIVDLIAANTKGAADLCVYFLLRANGLARETGVLGFIVTTAVAEGDSREVGIQQLALLGCTILRAYPGSLWPGTASVTYTSLWLRKGPWNGAVILGNTQVTRITPALMEADSEFVMPQRLLANAGISFNGSKIYGNGFLLNVDEAERIVAQDPRYEDVIMWYLTGQDLNNSPNCRPIKKVINFFDWPLERMKSDGSSTPVASDYPICLSIVRGTVKPERNHNNRKVRKEKWWQYGERASGLYSSISRLKWCICVAAAATKYTVFGRVSGRVVFSHSTSVVVSDSFAVLAILSCTVHEVWARAFGSHNLMLLRYSSSDLLGTFPFPISDIAYLATQKPELEAIGCSYDSYRSAIMTQRNEGLTETYNRFHDPNEYSTDIQKLRELHAEMDRAVVAAYGWTDLNLGHGLHATKQGVRFTISEPARRGILQCLLQLNHERYAEQSKHGGADAKKRRISKHKQSTGDGPPSTTEQPRLF